MTVPYAFANLSGNIALSKLDSNFNTPITIGNTSVLLGNTITTLNNITLANVTISSGNIAFPVPATSGGTGLVSPGTTGNVLTSNGTAWVSTGVAVGSGVTALSFGSTGLTPSTSTSGNVTVAGTLVAGSGGTGLSSSGTTGNVLTSNGSAWVSSAPAGGGSAMTLISTQTANNTSGILQWTGLSGYDKYMLMFQNILPSTIANFICQIGTGAGPTYITSGYYEGFVNANSGGVVGNSYPNIGIFYLASAVPGTSVISGCIFIQSCLGGSSTALNYQSAYTWSSGGITTDSGGGYVTNTSAKTAIKIGVFTGNIVSGSASLYGISS